MKKLGILIAFFMVLSLVLCSCGGSGKTVSDEASSESGNPVNSNGNSILSSSNENMDSTFTSKASLANSQSNKTSSTNTNSKNTSSKNTSSQSTSSADKSETVSKTAIQNKTIDIAAADFSVNLLKKTASSGENCMVSPVSALTALGMVANGANGDSLKEMQNVMFGGKSIDEINAFYKSFTDRITKPSKGVLTIANSTWVRDGFPVKDSFIKVVKDNFNSEIKSAAFDANTLNQVNNWVEKATNGKIKNALTKIDDTNMMLLINTIYLEMEWSEKYTQGSVRNNIFHSAAGDISTPFMNSTEGYYIEDEKAAGFIKAYAGNQFNFAALLPDKGVTAEQYLESLSGKKILDILKNKNTSGCFVSLPKFKSSYDSSLVEPLKKMGINSIFSTTASDLSKMAELPNANLYISEVKHKTSIEVNEIGTVASAMTLAIPSCGCVETKHNLTFDRPFIYMIIDNETNLPLFIGIMNNPQK